MALMTWQSIMLRPSPYQVGLRIRPQWPLLLPPACLSSRLLSDMRTVGRDV